MIDTFYVGYKINFFCQKRGVNLFTYGLIVQLILYNKEQEEMYKFLLKEKDTIFSAYSKVQIISLIDVQTLIFALKLTSLESKIPEFIERLFENPNLFHYFGLLEIFESILIAFNGGEFDKLYPLDEIYGPVFMKIFVAAVTSRRQTII